MPTSPAIAEPTRTGRPPSSSCRSILMMSYEFPPLGGGGAKVVAGLARTLVLRGYQVDLITMGFRGLPAEEVVDGIRVHRVRCLRRRESVCHPHEMLTYLFSALPKALRLARTRQFQVNHTHFLFPDGLLAYALWKLRGLPYVVTTHGSDVPGYNPDRFRLLHRLLAPLWRVIAHGARRIASPSETLAALMREQDPSLPITIVPNGFDTDRLRSDRSKQDRILVVTRMVRRKGVQHLLTALSEINNTSEVAIVGDGPYLDELRSHAQRLGLPVTFHGWMENDSAELKDLYETSRIFVLPSEAENFPISLLEAMAAGNAIITTSGTGCAEVVGDASVLVEPGSSAALRQALEVLVKDRDECARLAAKSRERLDERFSWDVVARKYSILYDEVYVSSLRAS